MVILGERWCLDSLFYLLLGFPALLSAGILLSDDDIAPEDLNITTLVRVMAGLGTDPAHLDVADQYAGQGDAVRQQEEDHVVAEIYWILCE